MRLKKVRILIFFILIIGAIVYKWHHGEILYAYKSEMLLVDNAKISFINDTSHNNIQVPGKFKDGIDLNWQLQRSYRDMDESIYQFDRPGSLLPLLRIIESEKHRSFRAKAVNQWLKSQKLIVAATVRNAMKGLPQSMKNIVRFSKLFAKTELVFVENNSKDGTRQYLLKAAAESGLKLQLLGCENQPVNQNCNVQIKYKTGKVHETGPYRRRNFQEQVERGVVMGALRNVYLHAIYTDHAPHNNTLLMVLDPDALWADWDVEAMAAGLYYFMTRPKLKQLCANTLFRTNIFDPCTLTFFLNKRFGEDTKYPTVNYRSIRSGPKDLPPVKMDSCFQGLSFYRLSHLAAERIRYRRSHGEWICEHNTLSRQLDEVYIDPQMIVNVISENS